MNIRVNIKEAKQEVINTVRAYLKKDETGAYVSLVGAKRLTYVTTAGGAKVDALDDHAFGYVHTLAQRFWHIPRIDCVAAWGLDGLGANVDALLQKALEEG